MSRESSSPSDTEPAIAESASTRASISSAWRRRKWTFQAAAIATFLMAVGVVVTYDAWHDIVYIGLNDAEQSQMLLVPVVAGWLLWVRRERLRKYVPSATWVGPIVVAAGWMLNRVGDGHNIQSFWHFGAILVVVGGFLAVAGGGVLIRFLPVFASLCFLVPVPGRVRQAIALPLQRETAQYTQSVLETLGAAVDRSGNMLRINDHDVMIAEACNGLRMVFALVMVSFAFAYGVPLRNWVRILVLVASPITAILFNVARLIPTVWAYGYFTVPVADAIHDASGWVMLPCAFLSLLGVMRLLRWAQIPITPYILSHGS